MDKVRFTYLENSDDIIISLSCEEGTEFGVDGFTIQRTPKYEFLLGADERGASIEWKDHDDIRVLLDEVYINREALKIQTKGKVRKYQFDVSGLPDNEYEGLIKHFHLINFDNTIKIKIWDK
jgi:hypothetical protein